MSDAGLQINLKCLVDSPLVYLIFDQTTLSQISLPCQGMIKEVLSHLVDLQSAQNYFLKELRSMLAES